MARIAGIDLPREKRVEIGLTYIYGIGRPLANKILKETGVSPDVRVKDLTEEQENASRKTSSSRVTSTVKSRSALSALWKSAATAA